MSQYQEYPKRIMAYSYGEHPANKIVFGREPSVLEKILKGEYDIKDFKELNIYKEIEFVHNHILPINIEFVHKHILPNNDGHLYENNWLNECLAKIVYKCIELDKKGRSQLTEEEHKVYSILYFFECWIGKILFGSFEKDHKFPRRYIDIIFSEKQYILLRNKITQRMKNKQIKTFRTRVWPELTERIFHPKNIERFPDWGFEI